MIVNPPRYGVTILLDSPDADGKILQDSAGQYFKRLLGKCPKINDSPLVLEDFLVLALPATDKVDVQVADRLTSLLMLHKPKCILALGDQALKWLTGHWGVAGTPKKPAYRGYTLNSPMFGSVVATYSPRELLKGKFHLGKVVQHDICRALAVAQNGVPKPTYHYLEDPSVSELTKWVEDWESAGCPPMSFDIETPYCGKSVEDDPLSEFEDDDASYTILRISFAWKEFDAISIPWYPPFSSFAERIFRQAKIVYGWNSDNFDIPRLRAAGMQIPETTIDVMELWHFVEPALPMGLKYVAPFFRPDVPYWKDLQHSNPAFYSCVDADVPVTIYNTLRKRLEDTGRWRLFEEECVELRKVLNCMSSRGLRVDQQARLKGLEYFKSLAERVRKEIQEKIPKAICPKKIFKSTKETLVKRLQWDADRMIAVEIEVPKAKKFWYLVDSSGEVLQRVRAISKESAMELFTPPIEGLTILDARPKKIRKKVSKECLLTQPQS